MQRIEDETRPGKPAIRWPDSILGPAPGLREIHLLCWGLFVAFLVVPLCVLLWMQVRAGTGSIRKLHPDFVYFYGVGRIVNEYPAARLYDYGLQLKVFNSLAPLPEGTYGPSPYPPFVAQFFSLFARIPFEAAYFLWLGVSLALYLAGIAVTAREVFAGRRLAMSLIFCFSLAFYPFVIGTLANGQLAAVAVCAVGVVIFQERHARPFWSGLALSVLVYKPTLLVLILPMLLLTRRFRVLLGFVAGAALLVLAATVLAGGGIWPAYLHFLRDFGRTAGVGGPSALQLWKYVDFSSFSKAIFAGRLGAGMWIVAGVAGAIAIGLGVFLWKSPGGGKPGQSMAWAATLTWTLLLNVYVPVYDTVLVTIAVILTLGAMRDLEWKAAEGWTVSLALLIFALSWVTVAVAKDHGVQLLTVGLTAFGLGQLYLLHRVILSAHSRQNVEGIAG